MSELIASLDIGTGFIRAVAAERLESGHLQIVGVGTAVSTGLRKGSVINIENTVQGIREAVGKCEEMSGLQINSCMVGLGGTHIEGSNSRGVGPVSDKGKGNREISKADVDAVINSATAVVIPFDREVMHVIPRSYTVDGQSDIKDPCNMIGVRLEAEVHIITGSGTSIRNIEQCVNRANIDIEGFMHNGIAAVNGVMSVEEQNSGSIIIDIGAGTTDIVVMQGGGPLITTVLPIGSLHVSKDLSLVKKIPFDAAERIKRTNGCCWDTFLEDSNEDILLPALGGRPPIKIKRSEVCNIFKMRMAEIFTMVKNKASSVIDISDLRGSIIICGGGALLPGTIELANEVFGYSSIRLGVPGTMGGIIGEYQSTEFAAAVGLLFSSEVYRKSSGKVNTSETDGRPRQILDRIKDVIRDLF